jgi:hypothetical protein
VNVPQHIDLIFQAKNSFKNIDLEVEVLKTNYFAIVTAFLKGLFLQMK